jgi:hypothetical protein
MTNSNKELKKGRHFSLTDTAYAHLGNIAHEARLSLSETFDLIEDYSTSLETDFNESFPA